MDSNRNKKQQKSNDAPPDQTKITSFLSRYDRPDTRPKTHHESNDSASFNNSKRSETLKHQGQKQLPQDKKSPLLFVLFPFHMINWRETKARLQQIRDKPTFDNIWKTINYCKGFYKTNDHSPSTFSNLQNLKHVLTTDFLQKVIPQMAKQCLREDVFPIKVLLEKRNDEVKITRRTAFYILCHMFFGTMPSQMVTGYKSFGYLMFFKEYQSETDRQKWSKEDQEKRKENESRNARKIQKLKSILYYFESFLKIKSSQHHEEITIRRVYRSSRKFAKTQYPNNSLSHVQITKHLIEQNNKEIMVDFANKDLGGGVLGNGLVQEEIMFLIYTELIVSMQIVPQMNQTEAVVFSGFRRYSDYSGYSSDFKFKPLNRKDTGENIMIAIDAFNYQNLMVQKQNCQLQYECIERQLKKAYVGFVSSKAGKILGESRSIMTGRWGCGAFRGNAQLKFLIQWVVCSIAEIPMIFSDPEGHQIKEFSSFVKYMNHRKYKVHDVMRILEKVGPFSQKIEQDIDIFDYIYDFCG